MSATLQIRLEVVVTEGDLATESIQPGDLTRTLTTGSVCRRTQDCADGDWQPLDALGITSPRYWFFKNIHATGTLRVSWSTGQGLVLQPGDVCWITSTDIPSAAGDGAASRLLWCCIAE